MSDLYSVIPGLQPTAQDVLEAELLAKQILEAKYPTLDLREGTGLRDLLIRPLAVFVALTKNGTDYLFTQNTLTSVNDATPPDLVDSILSNWFLTRKIGTLSVISSRLYFSRRKNVSISTDIYFSTDNTLKFYPTASTNYTSNSLVFDSFSNEYYVDVDLAAEKEGSMYNLGSGSLLYFSNFDPYFLRAEINYLKQASIQSESNTQFIDRAKTAISTRNLINEPSIDSNLKEAFNYIQRLVTVGMGDVNMIRDQIKAVFNDEVPRILQSLTSSGTVATATLTNHGYHTGQLISVASGSPSTYNGQFSITVVNPDVFTYTLSGTAGIVTSLPTIAGVNNPFLIHNGGMVDIYCSDSLATAIIQVTTDNLGRAHLTGPIYDITRSSVSGGSQNDTIPVSNTVNITNFNIVGTTATASTSIAHNFLSTNSVTIAGVVQQKPLTSISCSLGVVTATVTSHGYLIGDSVVILGVTPTTYNGTYIITSVPTANTFNYSVITNISSVGSGGSMTSEVNLLNGTFPLTYASGSTFSYIVSRNTSGIFTGTPTAMSLVSYTQASTNTQSSNLTSASCSGTTVTVNMPFHGFSIGRYVTITGATPTGYNGSWRIISIPNQDQFTFTVPLNISGSTTSGSVKSVTPWYDFGFSQNQDIVVDFGVLNSNKTASFQIKYFQNLDSIQSYLNSGSNRVLCADYLARGFNFYLLHIEVTSYNGPAPISSLVTSVISSYIATLQPGDMFIVSDMVAKLRINGIVNIQNPPLITFKKYTRDLTPVETGTIINILDPNDSTNVFLLDSVVTKAVNINPNTLVIN